MSRRSGFTIIEVVIVLVLIILVIALALPHTSRGHSRDAQNRAKSNLRQIGIALHSFHDSHNHFPFNGVTDSWADPANMSSGSWAYQVLPFLDQNDLYRNPIKETVVVLLLCPGRERSGVTREGKYAGAVTDYALNAWLNDPVAGSISGPDRRSKFTNMSDGTSNTFLVGQLALRTTDYLAADAAPGRETFFVGGTEGTGRGGFQLLLDAADINPANQFGSPFPHAAYFCMGDGSIRSIAYTANLMSGLKPNDFQPAPDDAP